MITNFAYPIGALVLITMVVAVFAVQGWRPDRLWWTLGGGLVLFGVADSLYSVQALNETVNGLSHAAMVYSLQASVGEAAGAEGLLSQLDHLVSRIDAKREPVPKTCMLPGVGGGT